MLSSEGFTFMRRGLGLEDENLVSKEFVGLLSKVRWKKFSYP